MSRIIFDPPILTKLDAHGQRIDYTHLVIDQYANYNTGLLLMDAAENIETCIDISTALDTIEPHPYDHFWYRVDDRDAIAVRRSLIHQGLIRRVKHQQTYHGVIYPQYTLTKKALRLAWADERSDQQ